MECGLQWTVCIEVQLSGEYSMSDLLFFIICGNIQILMNLGILFLYFGVPFMYVGVVSYLYMVSLVLCPSLLQIHPAGSLFQVSEYLPPLRLWSPYASPPDSKKVLHLGIILLETPAPENPLISLKYYSGQTVGGWVVCGIWTLEFYF